MQITQSRTVDPESLVARYSENNRLNSVNYYKEDTYCRTDIAVVQVFGIANVFFGIYGFQQLDLWEGILVDDEARQHIIEIATASFNANCKPEYIEAHRAFFAEHYQRAI